MKKETRLDQYDPKGNILKKIIKEYIAQRYDTNRKQEKLLKHLAFVWCDDELLLDIVVDVEIFYRHFENYILEIAQRLSDFVGKDFKSFKWQEKWLCRFAIDTVSLEMYKDVYEQAPK